VAGKFWTEKEDKILRDNFFNLDARDISKLLPGRTRRAVLHRAKSLGLHKTPEQVGVIAKAKWNREFEKRLGEPICKWLRRRYEEDEATYRELTAEADINTRTLMRLMKECNIEPISKSEAAKRLIRDNPGVLENLVASNHTPEAMCKRAKTREENWRELQSDQERAFLKALRNANLKPKPEHAIGRYNIDFAFPSIKLAVELDPLWHKTGRKAKTDARKDAFLESRGWKVLRLEARASTSYNVSKIEEAFKCLDSTH
jgi:very-short-patch-repair endonuclease